MERARAKRPTTTRATPRRRATAKKIRPPRTPPRVYVPPPRPTPQVRAPPPPPRKRPRIEGVPLASARGILGLALLLLLLLILAATTLPEIILFFSGGPRPTVRLTAAFIWFNLALQVACFFLIPVGYVALVRPAESAWRHLGLALDRRTTRALGVGFGLAVLGTFLLALVLAGLSAAHLVNEEESAVVGQLVDVLRVHPELVILVPLAAGVCEETLFRGFLQPRIGLLGSNVLFGLVHLAYGTVLQLVVPFVFGLGLGLLYRWQRSLWAPIMAHATFDLIQLILAVTLG